MAHHRRHKPKNQRAGCLFCKPQKMNGVDMPALGEVRGRLMLVEGVDEHYSAQKWPYVWGEDSCWECSGDDGCYWCGHGCENYDDHGPWVREWEWEETECEKCRMPRSYQKSPLEHFVEVLERERPLGRMAAVWP